MGLFFNDDTSYSHEEYKSGFPRYAQLLEDHWSAWMRTGLLTCLGAIPLAAGIAFSILSSSILLLMPLSFIGGMIFGPFYSCLFDNILRGLRDEYGVWREQWKKAWAQNWKSSLLPGGILGLLIGAFSFMAFLFYWRTVSIPVTTIILYYISGILFLSIITVWFSLLVLFDQSAKNRLINVIAFTSANLWKVLGQSLFQMILITIAVMLAPWSIIIVVLLCWYVRFLILYKLYEPLDDFFRINEQFSQKKKNNK